MKKLNIYGKLEYIYFMMFTDTIIFNMQLVKSQPWLLIKT